MRKQISILLIVMTAGLALAMGFWHNQPALADGPRVDTACRVCHGSSQHTYTFPSGEEISLQIDVGAVDQSPHNAGNDVRCSSCHRWDARYMFPHQPNPAQSFREFKDELATNCQRCHAPHQPFHTDVLATDEPLPNCVDCHGSHQIAPASDIPQAMPTACLTCHSDKTIPWARDMIPNLPGVGDSPAEGYVGSDRCAGCHEDVFATWQQTRHAKMIQSVDKTPGAIVGNFIKADLDRPFSLDDVQYTIGGQWKQRYLTRTEDGNFYILPAQWNTETADWVPYHADDWQDREWRQTCGSCHVTGLNTQTWDFVEFSVGCESCHGPGAEHAADPRNNSVYKTVDDQVCGACHSRGKSPDGLSFPATYRPGDTLTDHFTFTTADSDVWADGSARSHHQQYMDWQLGSKMQQSGAVNCVTCHSPHTNGQADHQIRKPLNDLCLSCHQDKKHLLQHTPFHEQASKKRDFLCSDCHLPKMATSAVPYDISNHTFMQPNPADTITHGGLDAMQNACNTCHKDAGETPQWAAETITYARQIAIPRTTIFRPGEQITPPPPPTPLPSVGQKPAVDHYNTGTVRLIRTIIFSLVGLVILAAILFFVYRAMYRSEIHG